MDLIPSEPIMVQTASRTTVGATVAGSSNQLLIETYKAWNKMHDPLTDGAITLFNYNIDEAYVTDANTNVPKYKPTSMSEFLLSQMVVGRCQYGLSLVGEELGQNKTIVSGKKTVLPFDLNFTGAKTIDLPSVMLCYLRADFIIYVRPDLIVTRLGL